MLVSWCDTPPLPGAVGSGRWERGSWRSTPGWLCRPRDSGAANLSGDSPSRTVVSDYVPKALQLPARAGVAGLTLVTFAGLMKLAITGPGIGGTVKKLWTKPTSA